ncbi:quinon protein alcohol dehydrogenase-like superfamily [Irpex rosettiformis]|uniref:Quinon protein alcohol dehydrogenase-like superfamily n=1 Tax=Irpex rosettiformis TaxID=378272 RepID=A0ACB8UF05_9APHY|nr:quinon protein alcohol dehydrogenase-like superfamily [Irpex rosettiformis]
MAETVVTTAYISAATNRFPHAAAVQKSLIAFASSTYVALWNTEDSNDTGVYTALPGHTGRVTGVRFINDALLLSADDTGVIKLWRNSDNQWTFVFSSTAHGKAISALAVYDDLIFTGASDSLVKIWKTNSSSDKDELLEVQTLNLKNRYPLSIDVTRLPCSQALILAIGSTDRSIQIWTRSEQDFVPSASLSGHEDWVKTLAFRQLNSDNENTLVLASGSQDSTIRLWNIEPYDRLKTNATPTAEQSTNPLSDELLDAFEASLGDLADAEEGGRQISLKRHIITIRGSQGSQQQFTITFDALLVGHEAGVTTLSWRPSSSDYPEPTLLSTSTDSSLILWSPSTILDSSHDTSTTLWINRHRFGDVGGQRLGGFVLGLWSRGGKEALGCGWSGGWRRWDCLPNVQNGVGTRDEQWQELGAIGGHVGPVKGLSWSPNGEYLISAGVDQTTRIHGQVQSGSSKSWHEISRPQVHGYDLLDAAFLDPLKFVSIADEKVARVFEAPREFIETVQNLHVAELSTDATERPCAATVPPLGLSNKAVSEANAGTSYDVERTTRRPFEGELAAFTLWPEIDKVFGHGYESITLAVSTKRRLAATACKATSPEHAVVRVYDTEKWQPFGAPLAGHTLTVTSAAFSPDDKYVVTVSRDRSWRLFALNETGDGFVSVAADKSHARIIWDCSWAIEGDIFATASRDKQVKIWHTRNIGVSNKWSPEATLKLPEAATAVTFTSSSDGSRRYLAIGLETGEILVYSNEPSTPQTWREDLHMSSQ